RYRFELSFSTSPRLPRLCSGVCSLQFYNDGPVLSIRTEVLSCTLSSYVRSGLPHRKWDRNLSDLSLDYFREPHNLLFRTFAAAGFMFPRSTSDGKKGTSKFIEKVVGYRSEEHTSELQSRENLVCRLLLEKKNER